VWRADLAAPNQDVLALLSAAERARGAAIIRMRERVLWMRARAALRLVLGRYLGESPSELDLAASPGGKPYLADPRDGDGERARPAQQRSRVSFSLAHSGAVALYALAEGIEVGVDLETPRRPFDVIPLARRTFDERTVRGLESLEETARQAAFLQAWTRHEAVLKCLGVGLGDGADRVDMPWVSDLELGELGAGALAAQGTPKKTTCWVLGR